jgi:hypothetical protein
MAYLAYFNLAESESSAIGCGNEGNDCICGPSFLPEVDVVRLHRSGYSCLPNRWFNVYPNTAEGCLSLVLADNTCNPMFFNYAEGGDRNCGCITDISPGFSCDLIQEQAAVSIYRTGYTQPNIHLLLYLLLLLEQGKPHFYYFLRPQPQALPTLFTSPMAPAGTTMGAMATGSFTVAKPSNSARTNALQLSLAIPLIGGRVVPVTHTARSRLRCAPMRPIVYL